MRNIFFITSLISAILMGLTSCHKIEERADDPRGNFEALWSILDEHYCFFREKGVDWDQVHDKYARRIGSEMTREELFIVCADMLDELRDGHVNLSAPFNTSYYRKWWSDYPQNFNKRLIEESYFNFNYRQSSGMMYGLLENNIGYIYYESFSATVGEGNLDYALNFLAAARGLIIDIRDNGGGSLTNVETLVARFIDRPTLVGYISHKTGPGHDDFSEPYAITYNPAGPGRVRWAKPVVVLTNRSTFSAANNFASVMKLLPGVRIAGATTGGGSGMPYSSEIPCGWSVRFSACSMLDANGVSTEGGVTPTEGCAVDMDPQDALNGKDTMLEKAMELLNN
ncbi:S41 family peptidase [Duncaniella freteri]|uniref:S41 family peptidase n=1 Tax=Duncaniella freteri TaxID=2530391 RepID=UPI00136D7E2B|nr:S41 family peptidase [Duncaniella freteri]NBJ06860.1 peptidase S41 [Alistipes sp. Z76]NCE68914.1 peptidase S41 [Muribaculaceae bacterium M3]